MRHLSVLFPGGQEERTLCVLIRVGCRADPVSDLQQSFINICEINSLLLEMCYLFKRFSQIDFTLNAKMSGTVLKQLYPCPNSLWNSTGLQWAPVTWMERRSIPVQFSTSSNGYRNWEWLIFGKRKAVPVFFTGFLCFWVFKTGKSYPEKKVVTLQHCIWPIQIVLEG